MSLSNKIKAGAASAALLAAPITGHFEGVSLKAYLDPVGIATICHGETQNVKLGDVRTREECDLLFETRLGYFAKRVDMATDVYLPVETHAALTSFTYNVGVGAFKSSTLLKKLNAGDYIGACDQLPRWKYAGGREFRGLIRRRAAERELCLKGAYKAIYGGDDAVRAS